MSGPVHSNQIGAELLKSREPNPNAPNMKILAWYEGLDHDDQLNIAHHLAYYLGIVEQLSEDGKSEIQNMKSWLTDSNAYDIGRALCFKSCYEYAFRGTFTVEGWEKYKERNEEMLKRFSGKEANTSPTGARAVAQRWLDSYPEKRERGLKLAASWQSLAEAELTEEALERAILHR